MKTKHIIIAVCGASGVIYGIRTVRALLAMPVHIHLMVSDAGKSVLEHEAGYRGESFESFFRKQGVVFHASAALDCHAPDNFFAPPASGSFRHDGMAVVPCTMKTLGAVASGISDTLIHRSADVCLKEKRPLILLTRETPLNLIHLDNMRRVAAAGGVIMPASPGFYGKADTVESLADTLVARVLDHLHLDHNLTKRWGES